MAFPRASMISDEYVMPEFSNERDLLSPLGIKDSGDWSQDGQSLTIDAVSFILSLSLNLINKCHRFSVAKIPVFTLKLALTMEKIIRIHCFLKFFEIGEAFL